MHIKVSRKLLEDTKKIFEGYLAEEGCDHDVGICVCKEIQVLNDIDYLLNYLMDCGTCGGNGISEGNVCINCHGEGYVHPDKDSVPKDGKPIPKRPEGGAYDQR